MLSLRQLSLLVLSSSPFLSDVRAQSAVATVGVCANLDLGALLNLGAVSTTLDTLIGAICVCEQGGVLTTNSAASITSAVSVGGLVGTTLTTIEGLLGLDLNGVITVLDQDALLSLDGLPQSCSYPANSQAACPAGSCGFTCNSGYVKCSGACYLGTVCPTGTISQARRSLPIGQLCPAGKEACRIGAGAASASLYECVDVGSDVEQCGGCMHPFVRTAAVGTDCTAITPFAGQVSCRSGSCSIDSCARGYILNGTDCVRMPRSPSAFLLQAET